MFVQGFDFAAETIKEYPNTPNPSLCDRDLTLKHFEDACKLALLDATQPDFGLLFKVRRFLEARAISSCLLLFANSFLSPDRKSILVEYVSCTAIR
jgi:hypothetical protein